MEFEPQEIEKGQKLENSASEIKKQYKNINNKISFIEDELKKYNINNDKYFNKTETEIQQESLFNEEEYLKNKSKLFKISLQITETIFLLNKSIFKNSIDNFKEKYTKDSLISSEIIQLRKSFSTIFYLFPVISTTLASSYNMLKNINKLSLLLCDEAGQATPQSLVGCLNKTHNALIVGDPLQVKPVFTAPDILIKIFTEMYKIDDILSPLLSSAQQIADNTSTYGSYYKVGNKDIWVGMPLVVHRRCIEPMFSISNEISYNSKMILATKNPSDNDQVNLCPNSFWIDVKSSKDDFNNTNTSAKEEKAFVDFIKNNNRIIDNKFYVISPFKTIYGVTEDLDDKIKNNIKVGTVHRFQGKEADIVFLILGGNVSTGAKNWVSSEANILNVAVTRAKKRIYIIGDYNIWKEHNYFKTATKYLSTIEKSSSNDPSQSFV